jgi:Family of unknown function (DUF6262)
VSVEPGNGLRAAAAARTLNATERARRALVELHKRGETITFAGVAARANVSRQFLYTHPDIRAEIERLRREPQPPPARLPSRERASDESIRTRLRVALDDNNRLREEIAQMREELALTHGRVRELELAERTITRARVGSMTTVPSPVADMSATSDPHRKAERT